MTEIWKKIIMVENAMHFNHGEDRLSYEPCTCTKALTKKCRLNEHLNILDCIACWKG